jgi:hypothetical protein
VDLPKIPSFDDLVIRLLVLLLGPPAFVIGLLSLVFSIISYAPAAKIALRLAGGAVRIAQLLGQYRPVAGVFSVFVPSAVLVAHLTVAMIFFAANVLTVVPNQERRQDLLVVVGGLSRVESIGTLLSADWYITAWYAVESFLAKLDHGRIHTLGHSTSDPFLFSGAVGC